MDELVRVPDTHKGKCECIAERHGHPSGCCEYTAVFVVSVNHPVTGKQIRINVCSPCEAQLTRVGR